MLCQRRLWGIVVMVCDIMTEDQARQKVNLQWVYYDYSNNHLLCWHHSLFSFCLKDQRPLCANLGFHIPVLNHLCYCYGKIPWLLMYFVLSVISVRKFSFQESSLNHISGTHRLSPSHLQYEEIRSIFFKELKYSGCKNWSPCVQKEFTCGQMLLKARCPFWNKCISNNHWLLFPRVFSGQVLHGIAWCKPCFFFYPQILFKSENFGSPPIRKTESLQGEKKFASSYM